MRERRLGLQEKALWDRVIATVRPLHVRPVPAPAPEMPAPQPVRTEAVAKPARVKGRVPPPRPPAPPVRPPAPPAAAATLDGHWDRRLAKGAVIPDVQVDLHGMGLGHAWQRLDDVLEQAIATGMRAILLVTGKPRDHDRASGTGRGAIRAAIDDWLHASRHARHIAAVRQAHPRHGGEGALYIILRKSR